MATHQKSLSKFAKTWPEILQKVTVRECTSNAAARPLGPITRALGAITTREGGQFSQTILSKGGQAADP